MENCRMRNCGRLDHHHQALAVTTVPLLADPVVLLVEEAPDLTDLPRLID